LWGSPLNRSTSNEVLNPMTELVYVGNVGNGDEGGGDDGGAVALARIQGRVKAITSMVAWQERTLAALSDRDAQIADLQAKLQQSYHLIQSMQTAVLGLDPAEAPPPELTIAWHTGSAEDIHVTVAVDGVEWEIAIDGAPRWPNPIQEWQDWQALKAALAAANADADALAARTLVHPPEDAA
jgi:uncharacterized coiled-coil protein SlyX